MRLGVFCTLDHHPDLEPEPRTLYRRAVDQAELADRLGLESFWVAEHHFAPYGIGADPAVLLAAMAERTRRLRLGTGTAVLPLRHPLHVAETYALLDQLSAGRLQFGVGSGYLTYEFEGFGVDPDERRSRFDEALAVLRLAWSGGPVRFQGRFHRIAAPPLNVRPFAPGGPPIHIGVTRAAAAPHVGRHGTHMAVVPYVTMRSLAELGDCVRAYREALPPGSTTEVTVAVHAFCGETPWHGPDDPAYAQVEHALARYLATRVVPGARYTGGPIARDFVLFGDREQLAMRLAALADIGVQRVLLLAAFGGLAPDAVAASLARLARLAPVLSAAG